MIDACNSFNSLSYPVAPTLFLEFHGTEKSVEEQVTVTGVCFVAIRCCCYTECDVIVR